MDIALHFIESDVDDNEQHSIDFTGDYDPIIDVKTGSPLSEIIKHAAETLRTPEKILKRLYTTALKEKWKENPKKIPREPRGKAYGRFFLINRHGIWLRQPAVAGLDDFCVWRRIAKTQTDLEAISYDTTRHHNWQHRYLYQRNRGFSRRR